MLMHLYTVCIYTNNFLLKLAITFFFFFKLGLLLTCSYCGVSIKRLTSLAIDGDNIPLEKRKIIIESTLDFPLQVRGQNF